ncbi:MAG: aminodeoxychorismate lyase [Blastococcus sp.]|nr:aminodeoxychorismate lyase [Blastococcus sp.]
MTDGAGRRGRHSSGDARGGSSASPGSPGPETSFIPGYGVPSPDVPGYGVPRYEPSRYDPPSWGADLPPHPAAPDSRQTGGPRRASGLLDRYADETGPLVEPDWWSYGSTDRPDHPLTSRHAEDRPRGWDAGSPEDAGYGGDDHTAGQQHPSAPLPPRPAGVWDRLHPRQDVPVEDAETVAHPVVGGTGLDRRPRRGQTSGPVGGSSADDDADFHDDDVHDADFHDADFHDDAVHDDAVHDDAHPLDAGPVDPHAWEEHTGGLEVIGAHVEDDAPRPRGRRARRAQRAADAGRHAESSRVVVPEGDDALVHDETFGEDIPVEPYDHRTGRSRRRRSPFAVLVSLLVLAGLVFGIVVGGQKLLELINPASRDYAGQGSGEVQVRVQDGDTLSDIGRTLVNADVIASVGPFVDAAEADADAVGIQPGVYGMRLQMSGQAALDLLLDPVSRLMSRVTVPEGRTVTQTLTRIAEETGTPVEEWQAAAADPAALGLPAYANGKLEGFLFPATYDVEPDDAPVDVLRSMVARSVEVLDELQIPEAARLTVVTKASIVQAEAGSVEDMGKVARVLENRLADGMPLQLDTTVNYANNKGGITTTDADRQNPSPYNTYVHPGLPPGAISNPGEDALRAVLHPTPGDWRFFVVVDPDTGDTRFAATKAEHDQNVQIFRQWLAENPEG